MLDSLIRVSKQVELEHVIMCWACICHCVLALSLSLGTIKVNGDVFNNPFFLVLYFFSKFIFRMIDVSDYIMT